MGSQFTNDDLVRESRFDADYEVRLTERPKGGEGRWRLELTPKKDAAVVWGRIVVTLEGESRLPLSAVYYDEAGKKVRTLTYSDVRTFSGVPLPSRLTLVPEDKPGEFTEIVYESLELGVDLPDRLFSKQALTR
jgi:outer membrane lipoprotein-sorting protein